MKAINGKHRKPLARLAPSQPSKEKRRLGGLEGSIRLSDDFDREDPRISELFS